MTMSTLDRVPHHIFLLGAGALTIAACVAIGSSLADHPEETAAPWGESTASEMLTDPAQEPEEPERGRMESESIDIVAGRAIEAFEHLGTEIGRARAEDHVTLARVEDLTRQCDVLRAKLDLLLARHRSSTTSR